MLRKNELGPSAATIQETTTVEPSAPTMPRADESGPSVKPAQHKTMTNALHVLNEATALDGAMHAENSGDQGAFRMLELALEAQEVARRLKRAARTTQSAQGLLPELGVAVTSLVALADALELEDMIDIPTAICDIASDHQCDRALVPDRLHGFFNQCTIRTARTLLNDTWGFFTATANKVIAIIPTLHFSCCDLRAVWKAFLGLCLGVALPWVLLQVVRSATGKAFAGAERGLVLGTLLTAVLVGLDLVLCWVQGEREGDERIKGKWCGW